MVARKKQLSGATTNGLSTMDKAMLAQQRTLAVRRQDFKEVAMIDAKLEEAASKSPKKPEKLDAISMVNVRNRKANLESSRKAEQQEIERKKLERKMAAENPDAAKPIDPSARLKIAPRTFSANTPTTTRFVFSFFLCAGLVFHDAYPNQTWNPCCQWWDWGEHTCEVGTC